MTHRIIAVAFFLFAFSFSVYAQLPKSNVYLFDMELSGDTVHFKNPRYLTQFNSGGYNNHPHFKSEEELLVSVKLPYEDQPDIYRFDLTNKKKYRVTDTPQGEYSPRTMPDFYNFSTIRMEFSGQDTLLRLWQFPLDQSDNGRPVFRDVTNIGYYNWLSSRDIALFLVDQPNQLVRADLYSGKQDVIDTNVGRCFKNMGYGRMLYVKKESPGNWNLLLYNAREYNPANKTQVLAPTLQDTEDFALMPDGSIIMASGSEIYRFKQGQEETWMLVADLRPYNIKGITRMEVSPGGKQIVIVAR